MTTAGIVGLFVVVMLAASVQGSPIITPPEFAPATAPPIEIPEETAAPSGTPTPVPEPTNDIADTILGLIFLLLGIAVIAVVLVFVVRALLRMWQDRPLRTRDGGDIEFEGSAADASQETDAAAPAIRRGIDGALRSIDEQAQPSDAIVAAWVGLEENAADAGLTRGRSETPAEFALRIITRRTGIADAATALLKLYERVRFGGHLADESDRDAARAALNTIEEGWR